MLYGWKWEDRVLVNPSFLTNYSGGYHGTQHIVEHSGAATQDFVERARGAKTTRHNLQRSEHGSIRLLQMYCSKIDSRVPLLASGVCILTRQLLSQKLRV